MFQKGKFKFLKGCQHSLHKVTTFSTDNFKKSNLSNHDKITAHNNYTERMPNMIHYFEQFGGGYLRAVYMDFQRFIRLMTIIM